MRLGGSTLSRYLAARLTKSILTIFVVFIILVAIVDFTQFARYIGTGGLTVGIALLISAMRGPSLAEQVLPFAVLFGAMITFVQLNRRLELTITRAAGVSAWQILLPTTLVTLLIGILSVVVYNPAAVALRDRSVAMGGFGGTSSGFDTGGAVWIRQNGTDGPSIIGAERTADDGTTLAGVTAFLFDPDGTFRLRIDSPGAVLEADEWVFRDPVLTAVGAAPTTEAEYRLNTNLTLGQIRDSLADPDSVPFWRLPAMIRIAEATALPTGDLRMRFYTLLAQPMMLVAMVLIAAVVSLRFSRTLNLGRLIVTGALFGFVLYLLLVVSGDLGRGGIIPPGIAAWAPVLLATLLSVTLLLREEDG